VLRARRPGRLPRAGRFSRDFRAAAQILGRETPPLPLDADAYAARGLGARVTGRAAVSRAAGPGAVLLAVGADAHAGGAVRAGVAGRAHVRGGLAVGGAGVLGPSPVRDLFHAGVGVGVALARVDGAAKRFVDQGEERVGARVD